MPAGRLARQDAGDSGSATCWDSNARMGHAEARFARKGATKLYKEVRQAASASTHLLTVFAAVMTKP